MNNTDNVSHPIWPALTSFRLTLQLLAQTETFYSCAAQSTAQQHLQWVQPVVQPVDHAAPLWPPAMRPSDLG